MNKKMEKKVFRSRISVLLILMMIPVILLPVLFISGESDEIMWALVVLAPIILLIVAITTSLGYTIDTQKLYIRCCGFTTWKIDLQDICLVKRSYNPLSSPAGSLKRLAVYQHGKFCEQPALCVLISPAREKEFLDALKACNTAIEIQVNDKKGWWRTWDWDI